MALPSDTMLDHLFRREHGKLVSVLTKTFGVHNLALAEDVVQDTLLKALDVWKLRGVPDNPSAWLFTVARNKALDVLRRERYQKKQAEYLSPLLTSEYSASVVLQQVIHEQGIEDEQLRMMFVCCHPSLSEEAQVALILKTLCGFSIAEIASAFLTSEDTITKRLFRAREKFREMHIAFELPPPHELDKRLHSVLTAIYLLFNEGYHASHHHSIIRDDLVEEALRLAHMLHSHVLTNTPATQALLALLCFHAARLYGRTDAHGNLLLLHEQDRTRWNRELIEQGRRLLNAASDGNDVSSYHFEAAIAYEHCIATTYSSTNWQRIDELYSLLRELHPQPLLALQHAIVLTELHGPQAGLDLLKSIEHLPEMKQNVYLYTAKGDWLARLHKPEEALHALQYALQCSSNEKEKAFLEKKMDVLTKMDGNG